MKGEQYLATTSHSFSPTQFWSLLLFPLSVIGYLNLPFFRDNSFLTDPGLFFLTAIFLVFLTAKQAIKLGSFEVGLLLFLVYVFLRAWLAGHADYISLARLALFVLLTIGIGSTPPYYPAKASFILKSALLCFVLIGVALFGNSLDVTNLYLPNKSIFGVLLAAQLAFMIPLLGFSHAITSKRVYLFFAATLLGSLLFLLAVTGSRAGWMGVLSAGFVLAIFYLPRRFKRVLFFIGATFLLAVFMFLLLYKKGSTEGRWLIVKISFSMFKDHWLFGMGLGQFKVQYLDYQAAYFLHHSIDNAQAMLADNTVYAFNDLLQLLVETGVTGFGLLCGVLAALLKTIRWLHRQPSGQVLPVAVLASLTALSVGALFSYAFQVVPLALYTAICLGLLRQYDGLHIRSFQSKMGGRFVFGSIALILVVHSTAHVYYRYEIHAAQNLSRNGFKKQALKKYQVLDSMYFNEANGKFNAAKERYFNDGSENAYQALKGSMAYYNSSDIYRFTGEIASNQKHFGEAQAFLRKAVYSVPNRISSRYAFFSFYLARKDTATALIWGESILKMPVKIPSQITMQLKKQTKDTLEKLRH